MVKDLKGLMTSLHAPVLVCICSVRKNGRTITGRVNMSGEFRYSDLKPRLNSPHHLLVCIGRHKRDRQTFGSETPSSPSRDKHLDSNVDLVGQCVPNTVKVTVSIRRTIIIHDDVDTLHVDPPTKDIGGDKNTLLKRLEGSIALDTIHRGKDTVIPQQLA